VHRIRQLARAREQVSGRDRIIGTHRITVQAQPAR
jgi:hypothetical protein